MSKGADWFRERFLKKQRREERHAKMLPTEEEPQLPPPVEPIHTEDAKISRNSPCPMGKTGPDGKVLKFKHCCGKKGLDHCAERKKQKK
jgi:hypothetical protein